MKRSFYLCFLRGRPINHLLHSVITINGRFISITDAFCSMSKNTANERSIHDELPENMAHLVSSRERFAESHGMTIRQVQEVAEARKQVSADLHNQILALDNVIPTGLSRSEDDNKRIGKMKHQLICQSRYNHQRSPFICQNCWTHSPICVCSLFQRKIPLPPRVRGVYVWTHHEEWGRTANTGSLLPLGLKKTHMLMKGLPQHDALFQREVLESDDSSIPVVLWPGKGGDNQTVTFYELNQRLKYTPSKEFNIVSIEGTWNNARKMNNRIPSHILRLDISEAVSTFFSQIYNETGFSQSDSQRAQLPKPLSCLSPSLLAPLRRQGRGKEGTHTNVSTLEATIIALLQLGLDEEEGRSIIRNAEEKVDRIRRFTGKVHARS